jgi:uncharacterized protein (DUF433 family)
MSYQEVDHSRTQQTRERPCVRGQRIAVADVLGWLVANLSHDEMMKDHPDVIETDIRACLAYATDRERRLLIAAG